MQFKIPELSLVILVGASSSGKSSFARKFFHPNEIVSSDHCRELVANDENALDANEETFDLLYHIVKLRLRRKMLTVVDATNVQPESRKGLIKLARDYHFMYQAIVLDMPLRTCQDRNVLRTDRNIPNTAIANQHHQLKRSIGDLYKKEGFKQILVLKSPEEVEQLEVVRQRLWTDRRDETGPLDIIGDVHGCFAELNELLTQLGYNIEKHEDREQNFGYTVTPPLGRKAVFVGDLIDRGPQSNEVLRLVMSMVKNETALCVAGNHDVKLLKKLKGGNIKISHGLAETLEQLAPEPESFKEEVKNFIDKLLSHYVLDGGKLVVAHAGISEDLQGRASAAVRAFCLYGETTGETDEFGLPVRYNWAKEYRGKALVVYGHTPVPYLEWLNNTIDIDTGCVFGGHLTALRYPERELVQVKAHQEYYAPSKPFLPTIPTLSAQHEVDTLLSLDGLMGRFAVETRLKHNITVREEQSIAALEAMSRFAIDPRWLVYLPPTMSPSETSELGNYLEHPAEAFAYYRKNGITEVVCQEKHMGSRAVVIVTRNADATRHRFGISSGAIGTIYTRSGRAFFADETLESAFLENVKQTLESAGFFEQFKTDWVVLDCELMPWSAKAQKLLQEQYAPVGAASISAYGAAAQLLQQAKERGINLMELETHFLQRNELAYKFRDAYRQYCWPVNKLEDYKLAPFHILATEGAVHADKPHIWHMEQIAGFAKHDTLGITMATSYTTLNLNDEEAVSKAIAWWEALTVKGGEGMVVKPADFIVKNPKGLVQPAIKCRGSEYLRIIYGLEYSLPHNLKTLRKRGLSSKRALALSEFALGIEALERFVDRQPLRKVHECVFAILALETEPIDPRL